MSIVELCMKELLMQQKLGLEYHFLQQQQNQKDMASSSSACSPLLLAPSPPSTIPPLPSPSSASSSSTSSSSIFNNFHQPQMAQLFSRKSAFVQQCPPPTIFDPLAAAVAANFMQHFAPQQQPFPSMAHALPFGFPTTYQSAQKHNFGFGPSPLPDFAQSPSCGSLNSTGSCASLDSFPSSGLSSSPDSSSNSSLNGPFPLIDGNKPRLGQGRTTMSNWPMTAPTDFSELAGKRALQGRQQQIELASGKSKMSSSMNTRVQQQQRIFPFGQNTKKRLAPIQECQSQSGQNAQKQQNAAGIWPRPKDLGTGQQRPSMEVIGQSRPSSGQPCPWGEPPKKLARKMGSTIFVPLEYTTEAKKKCSMASSPFGASNAQAMTLRNGQSWEEGKQPSRAKAAIPMTTPSMESAPALGQTSASSAPREHSQGRKLSVPDGRGDYGTNALGWMATKQLASAKEVTREELKPMMPLAQEKGIGQPLGVSQIKCELFELEEQQHNIREEDNSYFLADSPPVLTPEKENTQKKEKPKKKRKKQSLLEGLKEGEKVVKKEKKKAEVEKKPKQRKRRGGGGGRSASRIGTINEERVEGQGRAKVEEEEKKVEEEKGEEALTMTQEKEQLEMETSQKADPCPLLPVEKTPKIDLEEEEKEEDEKVALEGKKEEVPLEADEPEEEEEGVGEEEEEEEERETEGSPGKAERRIACRWTKCKERFVDDDQLYDHMNSAHVELLKKWVLAEQRELEKQKKAGLKRRRSNGASTSESTAKERFRCRWRKCEQFPRRGDAQKKLDWLLKHLVIRHAPKARPYCCIFSGCPLRFPKLQSLQDHLRTAHDDNNGRNNGRKSGADEAKAKVACFEFRPRVHLPIIRDCIDARTVEWIRSRLKGEEFALGSDQPAHRLVNEAEVQMERAKARKSASKCRSCSPQGEELTQKVYRALEMGEEGGKKQMKEMKHEAGVESQPRMSMHQTISHLKGLFKKMSRR